MTGSGKTRHGVRGTERRQEVLRAAFEVIAERGYRGATLGAVAERAGLTQQGLLHYFPTKEDLLIGVLQERDKWDVTGVPANPVSTEGGEREHTWPLANFATLVEYNAMRPALVQTYAALLGESITRDHPARDYFGERFAAARALTAATLRAEYGESLPGGGLTPEQAAPLLIAVMDGLQYQWLLDPEAVDMPQAFRAFLALLGES
ncbi:TetR/AcrR family transcriptional regulator [Streptomyces sp. ODS28]|uniref:TetR/AcrR family transcriptional regulator n=1 Tax=Streptomyces sp. ODS28 TaxID=3136688 RepID=UPI0031EB459B